jgi:hypothetical protein
MMTFELTIYDYTSGESFKVFVAGYDYTSQYWVNVTAYSVGDPTIDRQFTVRFGYSGGKTCFYIGELTSTWNHLQVNLDKVTVGYQPSSPTVYRQGWGISVESTAFENETASVIADQVGRTSGGNLLHHSGQDTGWLVPTLLNGWIPYLNGYGSDGVRYKKYPDGLVEVQGLVKFGTSDTIATLPVGFRPGNTLITTQFSYQAAATLYVRPDGNLQLVATYSAIWVTVNFTFMAEQ